MVLSPPEVATPITPSPTPPIVITGDGDIGNNNNNNNNHNNQNYKDDYYDSKKKKITNNQQAWSVPAHRRQPDGVLTFSVQPATVPNVPYSEEKSQAVLDSYRIINTEEEKDYDDITRLAATICDCPISLVSLIDTSNDCIFFKSHYGLPEVSSCGLERESAACYHAVKMNVFLEIENIPAHEIFGQNSNVGPKESPTFVFYAGVPLITPTGHRVGTLCVLDSNDKQLNDFQRESLVILARQVVSQMELRLRVRQVLEAQEELIRKNSELEQLNNDKAKLLGVISHDFKQPLTNTMLCAELLLATSCDTIGQYNSRREVASPSTISSMPTILDTQVTKPAYDHGYTSTLSITNEQLEINCNKNTDMKTNTNHSDVSVQSQLDLVQTIHANAQFMHILVDDMLQMARTNFGSVSVELLIRPVHIVRLIYQVCNSNSVCFQQKHIELSLNIDSGDGKVKRVTRNPRDLYKKYCSHDGDGSCCKIDGYVLLDDESLSNFVCNVDAHKIEQCINNLISNACKFSFEHSQVSILVKLNPIDNHVLISVSDEGQGIPSNELDLLFQAWKRPSVRPTAGESSSGLGLVIVKNIVEAHEGRIWVESESGKGSTFYISLPMPTKLGQPSPTPPKSTICSEVQNCKTAKNRELTILCAEDNIICQQLLLGVLKRRGHQVYIASDGREALDIFERKGGHDLFDAILVDGDMPKVSGNEVIRHIRNMESKLGKRIPIVSISGHNSQHYLDMMKEAGADHCCGKPFNTLKLVQLVESLCAE